MNERTWTAPAAGGYHVVTGQPPHLLYAECTDACGTLADDGSPNTPVWLAVPPCLWTHLDGDMDFEIYHAGPGDPALPA